MRLASKEPLLAVKAIEVMAFLVWAPVTYFLNQLDRMARLLLRFCGDDLDLGAGEVLTRGDFRHS